MGVVGGEPLQDVVDGAGGSHAAALGGHYHAVGKEIRRCGDVCDEDFAAGRCASGDAGGDGIGGCAAARGTGDEQAGGEGCGQDMAHVFLLVVWVKTA